MRSVCTGEHGLTPSAAHALLRSTSEPTHVAAHRYLRCDIWCSRGAHRIVSGVVGAQEHTLVVTDDGAVALTHTDD